MPEKPNNFWQELKRRKVIRVVTVYAAAAFVIIELTNNITEPLSLPEWVPTLVIVLLAIGFLISIVMSWVYDITPEGIEKTKSVKEAQEELHEKSTRINSWKIVSFVSIMIIIGLLVVNIFNARNRKKDFNKLERSIAVLPFDNMSVDEEYAHMGDAITDEIILELQKIHEFDRVLSRTSTMQYKSNRPTIPEIAEKLGVNYIVEGSIQRHNKEVSIRVQVICANPEDHIWGDKFEGKWDNIFSIQDEIAFKVANELKTVLSPEDMRKIEKNPTENIEAYNLYLKGRYYWNKRTTEGFQTAIEYFNQAIEEDPVYPLAYAGIADCYNLLGWHDMFPSKEVYPKAKAAAEKALMMDDALAEAHASLAYVKMLYDWDWEAAEKDFKRAIELNPNYALAHQWYSEYLEYMGRHDISIIEAERAQELDPLSPGINHNLGLVFYSARQYNKAIEEYKNLLEIAPDFEIAYNFLGLAYSGLGMYDTALVQVQKAIELSGKQSPLYFGTLGFIYASMGNRVKAMEIIDYLLELDQHRYIAPVSLAIIYGALDLKDQAFECMENGYEVRDDFMMCLKSSPRFDSLRSDPRFQDLVERMNFPD